MTRERRYSGTMLSNGDWLISDGQDMTPRLYLLRIEFETRPEGMAVSNNTRITLGSFRCDPQSDTVESDQIKIETMIFTSDMYLRREAGARSLGPKIIQALEREEMEIEYPYELVYTYGGQITR